MWAEIDLNTFCVELISRIHIVMELLKQMISKNTAWLKEHGHPLAPQELSESLHLVSIVSVSRTPPAGMWGSRSTLQTCRPLWFSPAPVAPGRSLIGKGNRFFFFVLDSTHTSEFETETSSCLNTDSGSVSKQPLCKLHSWGGSLHGADHVHV